MTKQVAPSRESLYAIIVKCSERIREITQREYQPSAATSKIIAPIKLKDYDHLRVRQASNAHTYMIDPARHTRELGSWRTDYGCSSAAYDWIDKQLPGSTPISSINGYRFRAPASWIFAMAVSQAWPPDRLLFEDEEVMLHFTGLLAEATRMCERMAMKHAYYRTEKVERPSWFVDHADWPLKPHQVFGSTLSVGEDIFGAVMQMGTGKTPMTINRICHEAERVKRRKRPYLTLIIMPKNIRTNWSEEIERFAFNDGSTYVIHGVRQKRARMLFEAAAVKDKRWVIVIAAYDTVTSSLGLFKALPWDLIVLDESQRIKSPYAKRGYKIHELRDCAKSRQILTGSLITNSPMDLYMQLEFLQEGITGFDSFKEFRKFYGKFETVWTAEGQRQQLCGYEHLPFMRECIDMIGYVRLRSDVLKDLPKENHIFIEAEMTPPQTKLYQQVADRVRVEIEADIAKSSKKGGSMAMTIENILTRLLRLAQVTAGIVSADIGDDGKPRDPLMLPVNPKIDAMLEIIEQIPPNEKFTVWSCFIPLLKEISRRLDERGINHVCMHGSMSQSQRDEAVQRINDDPTCRGFIANQATGGEGLNLLGYDWWNKTPVHDTNVAHKFFIAQNWSVVQREQAQSRSIRDGTRVSVTIYDVAIPGTVDMEIRHRVAQLREQAADIKDVKKILEVVLNATPEAGDEDGE